MLGVVSLMISVEVADVTLRTGCGRGLAGLCDPNATLGAATAVDEAVFALNPAANC